MRVVICMLCCMGLFGCEQKVQLPQINYEDVKHLTLDSMDGEQLRAVAVKQLAKLPFEAYQKVKSDPLTYEKEIQSVIDELKLEGLSSQTVFSFHANIFKGQFNPTNQTINLSFAFKSGQLVLRPNDQEGIFPQFIHVLLANTDDIANIPVSQFSDFNENFKDTKAIYTIEIVEAQHTKFLQAVIKQVDVYQGRDSDELVYSFSEQRKSVDIVNNRLLSDSYSLNLTPVHSFNFFGRRVLDPLFDLGFHNDACEKQGEMLGHQMIDCRYPYFIDNNAGVYIDVLVVGGKMVEISLTGTGQISEDRKTNVMQRIMTDLKLSPAFFSAMPTESRNQNRIKHLEKTDQVLSWEYFGVLISYDPNGLMLMNDEERTIIELKGKTWVEYMKNNKGAS